MIMFVRYRNTCDVDGFGARFVKAGRFHLQGDEEECETLIQYSVGLEHRVRI